MKLRSLSGSRLRTERSWTYTLNYRLAEARREAPPTGIFQKRKNSSFPLLPSVQISFCPSVKAELSLPAPSQSNVLFRPSKPGASANRDLQALLLPCRLGRTSIRDICSRMKDLALPLACTSGACKTRKRRSLSGPCGPRRIRGAETAIDSVRGIVADWPGIYHPF
jgi:hypothetical protein